MNVLDKVCESGFALVAFIDSNGSTVIAFIDSRAIEAALAEQTDGEDTYAQAVTRFHEARIPLSRGLADSSQALAALAIDAFGL